MARSHAHGNCVPSRTADAPARRLRLPEILVNAKASLQDIAVERRTAGARRDAGGRPGRAVRTALPGGVGSRGLRYGFDEGAVVFGGRKVRVRKPRVRRVGGGEVQLPIWKEMTVADPLEHRVLEQVLVGVSTHGYGRSLEPVDEQLAAGGTSQSSASRRLGRARRGTCGNSSPVRCRGWIFR